MRQKALGGVSSIPIYGVSMANLPLGLWATYTLSKFANPPKVTFLERSGWDLLAGNRGLGETFRNGTECHEGHGIPPKHRIQQFNHLYLKSRKTFDTPMLSSGTTGDSRKIQLSALLVEESNNKTEGFQRERGGLGASQNHSFS